MDAVTLVFFVFLLVAMFALFGGWVLIIFKYLGIRDTLGKMQKERIEWESRAKETYQRDAMAQLQQWRQQELDSTRQQEAQIAQREAEAKFEQWKIEFEQSARQDAIQRSQSVIVGKVTEHFTPFLPDFTYNPKDARFIGSPVDFVVFDGLNEGELKNIVFIEVKTGSSALSSRERQIRDIVQTAKVSWQELRPCLGMERSTAK